MKLIEADGKNILAEAGIAVPSRDLVYPIYLKAQVLRGRRGQNGLVRRCQNQDECERAKAEMSDALKNIPHADFLCEQEVVHESEWLVAVHLDLKTGKIRVSYSDSGGMDVAHAESHDIASSNDADHLGLPSGVADTLRKMFDAFQKNDALHMEINPLAVLSDGSCVALDAKVELDDAAAFRHSEWSLFWALTSGDRIPSDREKAYADVLLAGGHRGTLGRFIELDGDIAMILSGGGASLVAIDALRSAGGRPANYVEMSGNPDAEHVRKAAKIVLSKPGIRAIWIAGSFANFTDIQATVNAVLAAVDDLGLRVPIVIRRDGPNAELAQADALRWAKERGIFVQFDRAEVDFDASAKAVVAASLV